MVFKNIDDIDELDEELTEEETKEVLRAQEPDLIAGLLEAAGFCNDESEFKRVEIARNGRVLFAFRIRPLTEDEYQQCRERHTRYVKNKHLGIRVPKDTDVDGFHSALIYAATVSEDKKKLWDNSEVWRKLDVMNGEQVIGKALKAGEKDAVLELIDKISGYSAEIEETAKN